MALIALDASVPIALLDPDAAHHRAAAAAVVAHAEEGLRIPAHTLAEALAHFARAGKEPAGAAADRGVGDRCGPRG